MTLKYGRRPPKNAPALKFADILHGPAKAVLPSIPASEDWLGTAGWQMLGNDRYGDCVAVTAANERRVMGAHYATLDQVLAFYKTQNPGFPQQDDGMDIQTALEELVKNGDKFYDGVKPLAFAKVNYNDVNEVKAAIAIFGQLWTGLNVQTANMNDFNAGRPWDYHPSSGIDGGHSVTSGGYGTGSGQLGGDVKFITWAQETSFTDAFWSHQVEEAWVVIWPEHLSSKAFLEGVDQSALASAYKELTGRDFPVAPTPSPTPVPPAPPVDNPDRDLALAQVAWEAHEDNLLRMRSVDKTLEAANRAWRKAKGL